MSRPLRNPQTYTMWDEMLASPSEPTPIGKRSYQIARMQKGLTSIEQGSTPTRDDWAMCSDAVNLMETLVEMGIVEDTSGLLLDAIAALAMAGQRHMAGGPIRLDGPGIQAVRAVLEDYAEVISVISHRTMVKCHRRTEKRLYEILAGHKQAHDISITH